MRLWRRGNGAREAANPLLAAERVRAKYVNFRDLLTLNNESLELMAGLQDDLQFVPPRRDVLGNRIAAIFERVRRVVEAFERLAGLPQPILSEALEAQQLAVERYAAALEETARPRLSAWLSEVNALSGDDAGSKAAMLGEIRNKLGLPVPDGFVLTTEAYRQYCGIPLWTEFRDATRDLDLNDLDAIRRVAESLQRKVLECELPRAVEVAIEGRAETLLKSGGSLAVRSSARGEGGARSYAGQFLSLLNVPRGGAVDAFKQVIAARFSERALVYRLSAGLSEIDNPMAVLFLPMLPARAAGILYTRDPGDPRSKTLWITATRGLGLEIASGRMPADLFLVSRSRPHTVVERSIVHKDEELVLREGGGVAPSPLLPGARDEPSVQDGELHTLAEWGVRIEEHFRTPQDIEWVLDRGRGLWIVQSRPLANIAAPAARSHSLPRSEPRMAGGRTIYPG
ncbi:MAG TPA: PEP/pyruvate-binding domain-containing protein, partial [Candidatus Sulfopaludibacter sp.]|nr:PEP/pyruvate-binding domain-containing protein [Candidatus Sulfopaludibacter sp.]